MRQRPIWRSLLYVPANAQRFVEKAHTRRADALILDLEDSVPSEEKAAARGGLAGSVNVVGQGKADVLVRINQPLDLAVRDLESAVLHGVDGIVVTKVDGPSHVRLLDNLVASLEAERGLAVGGLSFTLAIEAPRAWLQMEEIFRASERTVAAMLGSEDFSLACDAEPIEEALLHPKQQLILTARACGLAPLGLVSSVADFSDEARVRSIARRSRQFGFSGATCVHPTQVRLVNEAFAPTEQERNRAQQLVKVYEDALSKGRGSAQFEGAMIDAPVVERARRLLEVSAAWTG